jgi:hypothetical protein
MQVNVQGYAQGRMQMLAENAHDELTHTAFGAVDSYMLRLFMNPRHGLRVKASTSPHAALRPARVLLFSSSSPSLI